MYVYAQKLSNPAISCTTIQCVYPTLHKTTDYANKIESEFLLLEGIQQTDFHMAISNDVIYWK